jgi:hypothetical protein
VQVGGIRDTQEQPLAAPEHRQHAVLGQQLVGDQLGDLKVNGQRIEVEQRHTELAGGGFGNGARLGCAGTHQLRDEMGLLLLGRGQGRERLILADDPVLHEPLRQAGEAAAGANIGH